MRYTGLTALICPVLTVFTPVPACSANRGLGERRVYDQTTAWSQRPPCSPPPPYIEGFLNFYFFYVIRQIILPLCDYFFFSVTFCSNSLCPGNPAIGHFRLTEVGCTIKKRCDSTVGTKGWGKGNLPSAYIIPVIFGKTLSFPILWVILVRTPSSFTPNLSCISAQNEA